MAHTFTAFDSFLLLPIFFVSVFSTSDRCYFLNGELAESAASCWDANLGETGLCCHAGDLCLNNTLCAAKDSDDTFLYYRGLCIDPTWSNPACPNFCTGSQQDDQTVDVYRCADDEGGTQWYCSGVGISGGFCELARGVSFGLSNDMDAYATAGTKPEPSPVTTSAEESLTTARESSVVQNPKSTSTPDAVQSSLGPPPVETETEPTTTQLSTAPLYVSYPDTATTATTVPESGGPGSSAAASSSKLPDAAGSSSPTAAPPGTLQDEGKSSAAVPIGVGVAVGTSVLIAASALVFFYQRKRRRQAPVRAETPPPFEFSDINSQAPSWLGPSYGPAKLPEMQGNKKNMPELGGTARFELQ